MFLWINVDKSLRERSKCAARSTIRRGLVTSRRAGALRIRLRRKEPLARSGRTKGRGLTVLNFSGTFGAMPR
jgi:hypothetical protein